MRRLTANQGSVERRRLSYRNMGVRGLTDMVKMLSGKLGRQGGSKYLAAKTGLR